MGNSLNREIEVGEVVVIDQQYLNREVPIEDRRFRCDGGFGMSSFTTGNAIYGAFESDPLIGYYYHENRVRIEGFMINAEETNAWNTEKGITILPVPKSNRVEDSLSFFGFGDFLGESDFTAYELENSTWVIRWSMRGVIDGIPVKLVGTKADADVYMKNLARKVRGQNPLTEQEELEYRHKLELDEKNRTKYNVPKELDNA